MSTFLTVLAVTQIEKKNYPLQLGQIIYVQIVALMHRNSQEFGTLNAFHQEIIVPKDLFKKINFS